MVAATVFVVSQDSSIRDSLSELVESAGLQVEPYCCLEAWLDKVHKYGRPGCLVFDTQERDLVQTEELATFSAICVTRPVLMLVDRGSIPQAVSALKLGALDVLEKPQREDILLEIIKRAAAVEPQAESLLSPP